MKRFIGLFVALLIAASPLSVAAASALPNIKSETYIVMDAASGQVLLERGAHNKMFPASITKILTCGMALEQLANNGKTVAETHTMSYEAVHTIDRGSTHIALTQEEVVTIRDLLNATMIESANDAANGLAEYLAGSLDAFPALANQKLAELGANDSHFVNGSGLHDVEHYTSAYDMALITKWALGVSGFREVFGATEYIVPATNKQPVERKFGTHHHMMVNSKYYYEGTTGGKLGWTPEAQHTLVTLAERDGLELICVVMRSSSQYEKYEDAAALLDAAFADYSAAAMPVGAYLKGNIPVFDGESQVGEVAITSQELTLARPAAVAKVDIGGQLIAPERYQKGETIAPSIRFSDKSGALLAEIPLAWEYRELEQPVVPVATDEQNAQSWLTALGQRMLSIRPWQVALMAVLAVVVVLFLIRENNLRKLRKRRKAKQARLAAAANIIDVAPEFQRRSDLPSPPPPLSTRQRPRAEDVRRRNARYPRNRGNT